MTQSISRSYLKAQFKRVGALLGWNMETGWHIMPSGENQSVVGYVMLQGGNGWTVAMITNIGGGEKDLYHAKTARELAAWFDGIEYTYKN